MAAKFGSKALQGLVFVVLAGGGLLYYSGRLDSFIQVHLRAGLPADQVAFIKIIDDAKDH